MEQWGTREYQLLNRVASQSPGKPCFSPEEYIHVGETGGMESRQQEESHSWQWFVQQIVGTSQRELFWSGVVSSFFSYDSVGAGPHQTALESLRVESQEKAPAHWEWRTQKYTRSTKKEARKLFPEVYKLYFLLLPSQFRRALRNT